MTKEGEALLLKVKQHILRDPKRLRMSSYIINEREIKADSESRYKIITKGKKRFFLSVIMSGWGEPARQEVPDCGTVGCIEGWLWIFMGKDPTSRLVFSQIEDRLGINRYAGGRLFYVPEWPEAHAKAYYAAKTARARAKLVAKEIDLFIQEQRCHRGAVRA
jgi:hypothetical protein